MKRINKELLLNITILYVEDEKMIRDEITYFFQKYVRNFIVATNGLEGVELFKKYDPDIIITDIQMPKMNGLDMIKEIDNKNIPIIITTAYSDIEYFLKAIELNVNKFVIKPINLIDLVRDIQECISTRNLQDKLFEKENLLKIVDENVLISITDKDGVIIEVSRAFCELTKYSKDELIGKSHSILRHEDTPNSFYEYMWAEIAKGKVFETEIKNRDKSGDIYWAKLTITPVFKDNEIINYTAIRQDITNKKKLEQLTIEDDLTKLYNRRYFKKVLENERRRVKRDGSLFCLIALDIDYFKKYNDTYGHPKGDEVLVQVAKVLKLNTSRSSDYAFRIGGEEFCIIFVGHNIEDCINYAKSIVRKVEELKIEHKTNKCSPFVTISAGLAVKKADELGDNCEDIYKLSDKALYEAKKSGRNQVITCF